MAPGAESRYVHMLGRSLWGFEQPVETDRKISQPFEILKTQRSQRHAVLFRSRLWESSLVKLPNTKCQGQINHSIPDFGDIAQPPPGAAAECKGRCRTGCRGSDG